MDTITLQQVTSSAVDTNDDNNTAVMLKHFGPTFPWTVEVNIYGWMDRLAPDYNGGTWILHETSNGGFWMHPAMASLKLEWHGNGFDETVSGEVAGLVACLFTFCHLAEKATGAAQERFIEYYYRLRDYALERPDAGIILRAID